MERNNFVQKLKDASTTIDIGKINDVLERSIESNINDGNPRGHRNLIIVMEELSELSQAIAKELRGKGDIINTLEETADVWLCLRYIQNICNISNDKLNAAINVKLNRLNDTLNSNGYYK